MTYPFAKHPVNCQLPNSWYEYKNLAKNVFKRVAIVNNRKKKKKKKKKDLRLLYLLRQLLPNQNKPNVMIIFNFKYSVKKFKQI